MTTAYWDPRAGAEAWMPKAAVDLAGHWAERHWLNVPGPFYAAETDTCCCGLLAAPRNVLYDEYGMEFVWKQPASPDEVRAVLEAAYADPFAGYNWDGDAHWTPELVIKWWDERERVEAWIGSADFEWLTSDIEQQRLADEALPAFREYLDGRLGEDLRRYADWLARRPA